jgi:hypothetical protein
MSAFNLNQDPPPECFGISWNSKDVLCAGGADLTHRDEKTGSHYRPPCDFYRACGTRVAHATMEQSRLIPATSLVRAPAQQQQQQPAQTAAPPPPASMSQAQMQQWLTDQAKVMATQMLQQLQQYPQQGRGPAAPYNSYPQGPVYDPRFQPMPVNYQMPAYLTVPEVHGSLLSMLLRTLVRSVFKAGGHSFSSFWDTVPLSRPPNGQGG